MVTSSTKKLVHHELFLKTLPAPTDARLAALEVHILRTGVINDPIVTWKGKYIVDGHARYEIAQKHGLTFKTLDLKLDTEEEVAIWAIEHQCTRRNEDHHKVLYRMGQVHAYYTKKSKSKGKSHSDKTKAAATKQTAELFEVSNKTVQNAVKHTAAVDSLAAPVKQKYMDGDIKVSVSDVAKLAELPKGQQKEAVDLVESGDAKTIGSAVNKVSKPEAATKGKTSKPQAQKDPETQKSFDNFNRAVKFMPQAMLKKMKPHLTAVNEEYARRGFT